MKYSRINLQPVVLGVVLLTFMNTVMENIAHNYGVLRSIHQEINKLYKENWQHLFINEDQFTYQCLMALDNKLFIRALHRNQLSKTSGSRPN